MNAFYFVVDETLADIAGAQALHLRTLWPDCDLHIFVERRAPDRPIREVEAPGLFYHYEELSGFLPSGLPGSAKWPNIVYLRLFAPRRLGGYDRLIYLDADIHGLGADPAIWEVPLPEGIGMVSDIATLHKAPADLRQSREDWLASIGVASGRYANSGFLLIDPRRVAGHDFAETLPAYFRAYPAAARFDQDFLNHHFDGRWTEIGPRFNWQAYAFGLGYDDLVEPVFIHFCKAEKPWYGEPVAWRSSTDPRYTATYDGLLRAAGFDPEAHRRPSRLRWNRLWRFALRAWFAQAGLPTRREKQEVSDWQARARDFHRWMDAGLRAGRFADERRGSLPEAQGRPVFDGRFVTAR